MSFLRAIRLVCVPSPPTPNPTLATSLAGPSDGEVPGVHASRSDERMEVFLQLSTFDEPLLVELRRAAPAFLML